MAVWPAMARAETCGDANGNGTITVTDGVQVLRAAAALSSDCTNERCDVNASGAVTVTDGVAVLQAAAALPITLTCPSADIEIRALGSLALQPNFPSPVMQIDVQGASSVTLTATTTDLVPSLILSSLDLPGGPRGISSSAQPPAIRTDAGAGQVTLTLPNTPAVPYADGTYRYTVETSAPTTATFQAVINRRQTLTTGHLNLRIFIIDPETDTPPDPNDPALIAIGEAINRKFADAGIQLGTTTFGTVPTALEQNAVFIDPSIDQNHNGTADQAEALFASTPRDTTARVLDLFIVHEFLGSSIIGFAGGIPGPVMAPATRSSGVVVAAFSGLSGNPFDTEALAQIAVHESAHYLGLFHTTELPPFNDVSDPLADTPVCLGTTFQEGPDACPDAHNLMFPLLIDPATQNTLSADQGFVLQRNPLIVN